MADYSQLLRAYQTYNPAGWVSAYRYIPIGLGIAMAALGILLLLFGSGRALRLVSGPLGAGVGLLFAPALVSHFQPSMAPEPVALAAAAVLGVLGVLAPPVAIFFAVGLPAGLATGQIAGSSDWLLGFIPAFLVCGLVGALMYRIIGAIVSSVVGAWILVIGLMAALHQVHGISQALAAQPLGVMAVAAVFALAGAVYQLAARLSPEEQQKMKAQQQLAKQRAAEQKALERRWANYSANRNK